MNQKATASSSVLTPPVPTTTQAMTLAAVSPPVNEGSTAPLRKLVSHLRQNRTTRRTRPSTEQLLRSSPCNNRAKFFVVENAGMPSIDWAPANHLVQTVQGSRLMGPSVIITGLSSEGAQTLEKRNSDLSAINRKLETQIKEGQRAEEASRKLSKTILQAQEEERKRLSRELHDEVGQMLTAINLNLAALRQNGSALRNPAATATIERTQHLLQEAMDTVHHFARELRPALLDQLGLVPALRSHMHRFAERTGLRVRLRADPTVEQLGIDEKTALFRIAQESLTNVAKHAGANRVDVEVRKTRDGIRMEIADDGKSFHEGDEDSAKRRGRLGLLGMQERTRLVNGRFAIKPEPGKGTTVQVVVPFESAGSKTSSKCVCTLKP